MCNKKIWGFILTMWYVNNGKPIEDTTIYSSFILTMWYANIRKLEIYTSFLKVL